MTPWGRPESRPSGRTPHLAEESSGRLGFAMLGHRLGVKHAPPFDALAVVWHPSGQAARMAPASNNPVTARRPGPPATSTTPGSDRADHRGSPDAVADGSHRPPTRLWAIALSLGLRRAKLLGLTWPMVDLDSGTVRVSQGVQRVAGRLVLDELKSERSHRTLPLPKIAAEALRQHRTRQLSERSRAGDHWAGNNLVFCTERGTPIDPRNINRSFVSLLIRARVRVDITEDDQGRKTFTPTVRLHDLRHSCASFLLASGASPRVVMEILGNSGIAITMSTYTHVLPSLLGDAAEAWMTSSDDRSRCRQRCRQPPSVRSGKQNDLDVCPGHQGWS